MSEGGGIVITVMLVFIVIAGGWALTQIYKDIKELRKMAEEAFAELEKQIERADRKSVV